MLHTFFYKIFFLFSSTLSGFYQNLCIPKCNSQDPAPYPPIHSFLICSLLYFFLVNNSLPQSLLLLFYSLHIGLMYKESTCQCRRRKLDSWVRKIPWRRKQQPNPVFLPGKSHGQRSLMGYSPWCCKELDMTQQLSMHNDICYYSITQYVFIALNILCALLIHPSV